MNLIYKYTFTTNFNLSMIILILPLSLCQQLNRYVIRRKMVAIWFAYTDKTNNPYSLYNRTGLACS